MTTPAAATYRVRDGRGWGVYAISAGRPANVPAMKELFSPDPITWVVPRPERHDYAAAGADAVLPVTDPPAGRHALCAARNAAMDHAAEQGVVCIQTDDDCKGFKLIPADGGKARPAAWWELRDAILEALDGTVHLAGVPPTDNAYFARGKQLDYGFIIGSLCATDTDAVRWDETLPFKEDYDYTCGHIDRYGKVARLDMFVASYQHYSNRGGAVTNRTPSAELALVKTLTERWPRYLRPHSRRPGELSFIPQRSVRKTA
ncbi:hypothetical protein AB0M39_42055 [Streptomyces sp. NPDC051907]|uniref:hypothetical protein n=1 Tax=Streptomyces sp. NPDC051907 TaxID=3155284 RepID=UPI003438ACCB